MTFYEDSEKKAVTNEGLNNVSNGLENFEINEETPELFNQETNLTLDTEAKENNSLEEDELEIPAFLRRQKN